MAEDTIHVEGANAAWKGHSGVLCDQVDGVDVIDCESCGFRHIVPIPEAEALDRYYREDFYDTEKPEYIKEHEADLSWWEQVYAERYDLFESELPAHRRRILDVGCGPGFFLHHGRQRGWDVQGIEPSQQAVAFCRQRQIPAVNDFLCSEILADLGRYDVVMLDTVLEHIPDPGNFLSMVATVLEPGGLVCVTTANDYNPLQSAVRRTCDTAPWWIVPRHHVNYFDFDSLSGVLEGCGFDILRREGTFPMELFLLMGEHYVGNHQVGRRCHEMRKRMEMRLEAAGCTALKRDLYQCLAQFGIGREVVLYARKPADDTVMEGDGQ